MGKGTTAISAARLDVLTGKVFGRLTVLDRGPNKGDKPTWNCICSCGNSRPVRASTLRKGTARSCGCLSRELTAARSVSHGKTHTREFETWRRMKERCYVKSVDSYPHYGGRGIRVCDRWLHSFESFLSDMGERPENHSLDRIDSNADYSPENCKWSTVTEQNRNKRSNVRVTIGSETKLAADWAREYGISQGTFLYRYNHGLRLDSPVRSKKKLEAA